MSTNAFKSEFDINCVSALQDTWSVSTIMISQLMLFREALAVYAYWENNAIHRYSWWENAQT